jgi:hypothetical protein
MVRMGCNRAPVTVRHTPGIQTNHWPAICARNPEARSRNVACAYAILYLCQLCALLPVLLTVRINSGVACSTIMFKYAVNTVCNVESRLPSEFISALKGGCKSPSSRP